jgi:predicted nucleotidyltransferase
MKNKENNNVLVKFKNDPLAGYSREETVQYLREKLKNRAKEVYVFGSFAENKMTASSDIDLIIVNDVSDPFTERASKYKDLYDAGIQFDILVYTPSEWEKIQSEESVGFWKTVKSQLKIIPL